MSVTVLLMDTEFHIILMYQKYYIKIFLIFKKCKNYSWAIQKQIAGQVWPMD